MKHAASVILREEIHRFGSIYWGFERLWAPYLLIFFLDLCLAFWEEPRTWSCCWVSPPSHYYDLLTIELFCMLCFALDIYIFTRKHGFSRFLETDSSKIFTIVVGLSLLDIFVAFCYPILGFRFRVTRVMRPIIGVLKVEEMRTFCVHMVLVIQAIINQTATVTLISNL